MSSDGGSDGRVEEVDIAAIELCPYQPRADFDEVELEALAASIRHVGLIQPPIVRTIPATSRYELVAGERRLRAAQKAGLTRITVLIREFDNISSAEAALIENVQRVDLNPLEVAKALRNLIGEFGYSQEALAEKIGKKRSTVSNYLRLLGLSRPIQLSLRANRITMGHAKAILSLEDNRAREAFHEDIVRKNMTVRDAERIANKLVRGKKSSKDGLKSLEAKRQIYEVEKRLETAFGLRVTVQHGSKGNGTVTLHYSGLDDLDALLQRFDASPHTV